MKSETEIRERLAEHEQIMDNMYGENIGVYMTAAALAEELEWVLDDE